jgi:hypothetical protein
MSELLWVAVPGGKVLPTGAVLRALVVPRLSGLPQAADLEAYGFADWPSRLSAAVLRVERADEPGPDATEVISTRVDPPAGIGPRWSEVFGANHLVRAYRPPPVYNAPRVDQSATQARVIRGVYTDAAARPDQPDALESLNDPSLNPLPPVAQTQQTGTPVVPAPDFHRVLTMLREHPRVLMGLGLIVELRLPDPAPLATGGVVRVVCELEQQQHEVTCVSPWTRYIRSPESRDRFLAAPSDASDIDAGMLRLDPTRWALETFDVTGAVDRLRDETARRRRAESPGPAAAELPTLRSAGLSLMRHDRARQLEERVIEGAMNTRGGRAMGDLVLTADHLVLGYRIDVRSTDSGWRSVMQRRAAYTTAAGDPEQAPKFLEEGQVKANAVTVEGSRQAHELDAQQQLPALRADEVLARWDGWSLTCPKPGTAAARRDRGRKQLPYLGWSFEPIGLPVLRFGNTYRMRVRVADAAGGGLAVEDPNPTEHQSHEVFYGRHDPVPPPVVVPPAAPVAPAPAPGPGDAVDVLVIRSDPQTNRKVADFAAQFAGNDRRTLLPPSAPWFLVEQHGRFGDHQDPVEPGEPDEATYAGWLARSLAPEAHQADGTYSWLPDPMAEGIALAVRAEPGTPRAGETVHEGWAVPSGDWPDFPFKTLALEELTAQHPERLDWTDNHRRGVVRLRPGEQLSVEVTSTVVSTDTGLFAMEHWLNNPVGTGSQLTGASIAGIMELVRSGRHPMVSPSHVLRLVHAVPHPVTKPQGTLTASRGEGETFVDLVPSAAPAITPDGPSPLVELGVHVPSTGQVELRSSWSEPVDGGDPQEIRDLLVQVARLAPDAPAMPLLRHELGDTRHRVVTYQLRAISRYRDYFPPSDDPAAFAGPALEQVVSIPSSARPPEPVLLSVAPAFRWSGTELPDGWTEVRRSRAGGVVRVELGRPWLVSGVGERLAVLLGGSQTTVRRDPIWPTALPPALGADAFRGSVDDAVALPLPEIGADVTAVPYQPAFLPDGDVPGHWFVDVELPGIADASYGAFVSLAVARYQPDSLPGLHLSRAVRAEPVQLLPSRTLRVTRSTTDVRITLSGLQPDAPPGPPEGPFEPLTPRRTRVDAHLEELPVQAGRPDVTAVDAQVAVGWRRIATVSGEIGQDLDLALPAGDRSLRVVVREVEQLRPLTAEGPEGELGDRVVFLDVVPLR